MKRTAYWLIAGMMILGLSDSFVWAGNTNAPAAPTDPASAMYSLGDIHSRLTLGALPARRTGAFTGPVTGPGPTLHTLTELKTAGILPQRTGQTANLPITATAGMDGALQVGLAWPNPRFSDNGDGTVTDHLTGFVWLKNADALGAVLWANALNFCASLQDGTYGLTDGSVPGDWRLPNLREMMSLIAFQYANPSLSDETGTNQWTTASGSFTNVQSAQYWTSTSQSSSQARYLNLSTGATYYLRKTGDPCRVWPLRNRQTP